MEEVEGKVTIAPSVLTAIVRLTVLENSGVERLGNASRAGQGAARRHGL